RRTPSPPPPSLRSARPVELTAAAIHPLGRAMAGAAQPAAPHWMASEEPGFRRGIIHRMVTKFMGIINSQQEHHYQSLHRYAVRYEVEAAKNTTNKEAYLRYICQRVMDLEVKLRQLRKAGTVASERRPSSQQQNVCTTPQSSGRVPDQHRASAPNTQIEDNQEQTGMMTALDNFFNFSTTEVSPVATPVQPSQRPMQPQSQHQQQAKQLQPTKIAGAGYNPTTLDHQVQGLSVVGQNFQQNQVLGQNSSGTRIQLRQLAQTQQQQQEVMRMNQQYMRGNQQQNCTQINQNFRAQQAHVAKMQIGHPGVQNNQQNVGMECHPMTPPQRQVAVAQQNSPACQSPQTSEPMVSAGEVDWREEIFQKIKSCKDAYLSELLEFDRMVHVPKITQEQFRSLSGEKVQQLKRSAELKKIIARMLDLLNIQKSNVQKGLQDQFPIFLKYMRQLRVYVSKCKAQNAETKTGCQSQNCRQQPQIVNLAGNTAPFTCDASRQQKQQEQLTDAKISKMEQAIITRTPTAQQENHGYHLLGVPSPCFSPGAVQPLSTNTLEECFTPSPVTKPGVVKVVSPHVTSPSASVKSSVAKPAVVRAVSPCASVKSRLASPTGRPEAAHVASPSTSVESTLPSPTVHAASPCAPVKSTSQSPLAKPGSVQVDSPRASVTAKLQSPVGKPQTAQAASPCASVKSKVSLDVDSVTEFLLHGIVAPAAENGSNQATPTQPLVSASPLKAAHQAEDQVCNGDERMESKKPISRLIQVLSSSPEVLRSSANSLRLAIWEADRVPLPPLPCQPRDGKMKRRFDQLTSRPVSSPLSSNDESCMTFECGAFEDETSGEYTAKRQKLQNASDALLCEIKTINSKLIDTVISIADENGTDGTISPNGGGTLIKLSYSAVSLAPSLKSLSATSQRIFVPVDYPRSSPMLVDNDGDDEQLRKLSDISHAVAMAFRRALCELPEPRSIEVTAMAWDDCVRRAVTEVAHLHGGGTFSSRRSQWRKSCMGRMMSL
ncbi:hypothetical protein E2562_010574, partial [Oryza meyeriana var. granulata]